MFPPEKYKPLTIRRDNSSKITGLDYLIRDYLAVLSALEAVLHIDSAGFILYYPTIRGFSRRETPIRPSIPHSFTRVFKRSHVAIEINGG